ncbi:MAG: hypothetical protein WCO98_16945 [bacterium]
MSDSCAFYSTNIQKPLTLEQENSTDQFLMAFVDVIFTNPAALP